MPAKCVIFAGIERTLVGIEGGRFERGKVCSVMRKAGLILGTLVACIGVWAIGGWAVDRQRARAPADMALPPIHAGGGAVRIVAFGTSLTARAIWPQEVEGLLDRCLAAGAEITRVARPGANSDWGGTQVGNVVAGRPDLVIVEFAINDSDLLDGLSRGRSRSNHEALIGAFRAQGAAVLLVATNPVGRLAALKRPLLPAYQDLYPALAQDMVTGFFDGELRWRQFAGWRSALPDGVHPDPAVEAQLFAAPIAAMIGRALGADCGPGAKP